MNPQANKTNNPIWLRLFSKITCLSTLFLIFVGGMVTSTGSGLSVPDWPLSYGTLFPPMVGGIFYEHSHRMVASFVGLLTLILAIWINRSENRRWVKRLSFFALCTVIAQGILGGMTVKFLLPPAVSVSHAVLAQTFFILTIIIVYSQSIERSGREAEREASYDANLTGSALFLVAVVYIQLILGALMRHTASGLAIPDFPTFGGRWIPSFDGRMLSTINSWRFGMDLPSVTMGQVVIHFLHRVGAAAVFLAVIVLTAQTFKTNWKNLQFKRLVFLINFFVILQLFFGAFTVLSQKSPVITSLHVMMGALLLGCSVLLVLRASPLSFREFKRCLGACGLKGNTKV